MEGKKYTIYAIQCTVNQKLYIGATRQELKPIIDSVLIIFITFALSVPLGLTISILSSLSNLYQVVVNFLLLVNL